MATAKKRSSSTAARSAASAGATRLSGQGAISTSLRVQRIIVRILYAQQVEQEGKDDLTFGVASRAIEICIFLNYFPDAEIQRIVKTGKGIAYITAIVEGKLLILRFELTQACLQLPAF